MAAVVLGIARRMVAVVNPRATPVSTNTAGRVSLVTVPTILSSSARAFQTVRGSFGSAAGIQVSCAAAA
jgi:hypothetical protein